MFEPTDRPRVYGVAPGVDFPDALVQGIRTQFSDAPAHAMANVQIIVNTRRMQRRIRSIFDSGPSCLLPRIQLLTDFGRGIGAADIPPPVSPIRRRFELVQLISSLLRQQPDLAARTSIYDLADSLAGLMDEMNGEGVSPDAIEALDVSDQSGHWERAQKFFGIARHFLDNVDDAPDSETRQRMVIERLVTSWEHTPPQNPVIVAGSTGSRGTTALLMEAVARLPQGALVLPGFDFDTPKSVWESLSDALSSEDHPQFRFHKLAKSLGIETDDILNWTTVSAPNPARNKLVSLALRPAPVTDQWLKEGPKLADLEGATKDITLLLAPSMRDEALAIALRLRQAAEDGQTAALISPDRMLTRQVTAALGRWDIVPDDSAGTPLQLSPPGRFLRHISTLFHRKLTSETLLTLLKHPLTHSGTDRNIHLLNTRDLELSIRKHGITYPDAPFLSAWSSARNRDLSDWGSWLVRCFCDQEAQKEAPLEDRLDTHIALAEDISKGVDDTAGRLWDEAAGRSALHLVQELQDNARYAGSLGPSDYSDLFGSVLGRKDVRDRDSGHPNILIWGTLEARVQGADLVILGGLNDGSWPESPTPDPWLNRSMRHKAGLLLPERRIGLSAHDFQQAVGAPQVWLTRSIRSDDSETVPSRWINRLANLLEGLPGQGGDLALHNMTQRGQHWLSLARELERFDPIAPATRPSPRPPVSARPKQLSVTEIKKLIRDPYAIFARHVLRLRPLNALMRTPDALLRGIVVHDVLERFVKDSSADPSCLTQAHLTKISETVLAENVPWPAARTLWQARVERAAEHFILGEKARQATAIPIAYERKVVVELPDLDFKLTGQADRIDRDSYGHLLIYDYKTGTLPTKLQQRHFDKQLLLEAAMAEQGGFAEIDPAKVSGAVYLAFNNTSVDVPAPLDDTPPAQVWSEFQTLIRKYLQQEQGFTARRALRKDTDHSDYDQLARFGEWDVTDEPAPEELT